MGAPSNIDAAIAHTATSRPKRPMKHPMTAMITPRVRGIHTGEPITAATMNATNHDLGVLGDLSRAAARGTAGISEMMRAAASAGGSSDPTASSSETPASTRSSTISS